MPFVLAEDHGFATGATAATNSTALSDALNACVSNSNPALGTRTGTATLILPGGTFKIGSKWDINNIDGIQILGSGQCTLDPEYDGDVVLNLDGLLNSRIENVNISMNGTPAQDITTLVRVTSSSTTNWAGFRNNLIRNCRWESTHASGRFVNGLYIGESAHADSIIASNVFEHIRVDSSTNTQAGGQDATWWQYGYRIGTNTWGNVYRNDFYHGLVLRQKFGVFNDQSEVSWIGGGIDDCEIAWVHESRGQSSISDFRIEQGRKLLRATGAGTEPYQVLMRGVLFLNGEAVGGDKFIEWDHPGHLLIRQCLFDRKTSGVPMSVDMTPKAGLPAGIVNMIEIDGSNIEEPIGSFVTYSPETTKFRAVGYVQIDDDNDFVKSTPLFES